jgi:STE24 endopeptidase
MSEKAAERQTSEQARHYQAVKRHLCFLSLILSFGFLVFFVVAGYSGRLAAGLKNLNDGFLVHNALYFSVLSLLGFCLSLPLDVYEGYILERRYSLSRQTFKGWLGDHLKKGIITFIVGLVIVEAVYVFLEHVQESWWLWAAFFWFFISVIIAKIFPRVILPLFFKPTPLSGGVLRERIFSLLEKYGIPLKEIYVLDFSKKTVKANAMVAGLGRTKQIYLSDTLVNDFTQEEVEVVLAHELGHYLRRDILKLTLLNLVLSLVSFFAVSLFLEKLFYGFGFMSLTDIAGLPLLLLVFMLMGFVLLPLQNAFSRSLERGADRFALDSTGHQDSFISMMRRLGEKNFAEFEPSRLVEIFFYSHPPIQKRIQMALKNKGHPSQPID